MGKYDEIFKYAEYDFEQKETLEKLSIIQGLFQSNLFLNQLF